MNRSASRLLTPAVATLAMALTSCGQGGSSSSELDAVAEPINIGDASGRHGASEVMIYYANETAPNEAEKANWDSILASLKSDEKTAFMTETLENDLRLFPLVVDDETQILKDYFCSNKNKLNVSLVIFTNRLTRAGLYEYCEAGKPAQVKSDSYMSKFQKRHGDDFRVGSNPLAHKETLRWALTRTRLLFSPDEHIYSFVMKSHGNADYVITPRLHVNAKKISRRALLGALKSTIGSDDDRPSNGPRLTDVSETSDKLKKKVEASDAKLEKMVRKELDSNDKLRDLIWKSEIFKNELFKNELMKNELMKNELMKNELMKNELIKEELMKNELIKNELMKNELAKEELFKSDLMKNELMKNELIKNELMKNELMKNELMKNELMKNELMKNELMKNELMKNELMKNELMKNELMKNELMKNELMKNELMKNELMKNELMKNELTKDELAADGATAADGVEEGTDLAKAVLPRVGVTKREFLTEIAASGSRNNIKKNMHFSVVFTEACRSYLPWDLQMEIGEASEALKVDYLASSDEGSVRYKNIDYAKFLGSLDESKSFGENLKNELSRVAEEAKR